MCLCRALRWPPLACCWFGRWWPYLRRKRRGAPESRRLIPMAAGGASGAANAVRATTREELQGTLCWRTRASKVSAQIIN